MHQTTPKKLSTLLGILFFVPLSFFAQSENVNVFLGTSGDHGQLSPAASYPFGMISIGPQTYPKTHPGYEYYAKEYRGFTHNRMEGVGCLGDGGVILVHPFQEKWDGHKSLIKEKQSGTPGYYSVDFKEGISAEFTVNKNLGVHHYTFSESENGLYIDLSHAFVGGYIEEQHEFDANGSSGFIRARTTCSRGIYKFFYDMQANVAITWEQIGPHQFLAKFPAGTKDVDFRISFSSVDLAHAKSNLTDAPFSTLKQATTKAWDKELSAIKVEGDKERKDLFYSLLYRSIQSPFVISEADGSYRATDGSLQNSDNTFYNGWAIWDNYKTQLPLLSFAYPERYDDIAWSIAQLYKAGKKDFSTDFEPSQTVRTEHAIVVLLDAMRKDYDVPVKSILDSLVHETDNLDFHTPDKALESSYDTWALAEILKDLGDKETAKKYTSKALEYKQHWEKDFKDMSRNDVDRMSARNMYQGTIWQYRWLVPYDIHGLQELAGGEDNFIAELDEFFGHDYYNHANETDIQAPYLYHATKQPWKSQELINRIAVDTLTQFYFNNNSRGVDPYIGRVYQNKPRAFLSTMDDDAGAMSAWFVLAGTGLTPAAVGMPQYYLHVPLFKEVTINGDSKKPFVITVENFDKKNIYIEEVFLNNKKLNRNWITHQELQKGGKLTIKASPTPVKTTYDPWATRIDSDEK